MNRVIQIIAAAGAGACGFLFGEMDGLLYALITFMILDYITGVLVAAFRRELSSKVGFRGLAKKGVIFAIVALGHILDAYVLSGGHDICRCAAVGFYLANEGLSILENGDALGIKYPKIIKSVLLQIREKEENEDE